MGNLVKFMTKFGQMQYFHGETIDGQRHRKWVNYSVK